MSTSVWVRIIHVMVQAPLAVVVFLATASSASGVPAAGHGGSLRSVPVSAMSKGGLFFPGDEDGRLLAAPLLATEIEGDVSGIVARYRLRHTFHNSSSEWTEAVYTFPLPTDAAVDRLTMKVGNRTIKGTIKERKKAKATYNKARKEGRRASLIEQQRPNIFTTSVANIAPGEAIVIEIGFQETIPFRDGRFEIRLPLVIGPRYIPGVAVSTRIKKTGWAVGTNEVPDAGLITPPVRSEDAGPGNPVTMRIRLQPGFPIASVASSSHAIKAIAEAKDRHLIELRDGAVATDRDFVLSWMPSANVKPSAGLFSETINDEHYLLLSLLPPIVARSESEEASLPREVIFIIDTSGSMHGRSLAQAKKALDIAIRRLRPRDRFNVIGFSDVHSSLFSRPLHATARLVATARKSVRRLEAEGGTEIVPAVAEALDGEVDPERIRQVVLITDGSVGNEDALFSLIENRLGDTRLFTVGIGSAPNDYLMTRAATAGRGSFIHIGKLSDVLVKTSDLLAKLETPALTDIKVQWIDGVAEIWPAPVPDLYAGEPLTVTLKGSALKGHVRVSGRLGKEPWETAIPISTTRTGPGVASIWARTKIRSLMDEGRRTGNTDDIRQSIIAVALEHQLVSRHTSLVAVDSEVARPANMSMSSVPIATNLPDGWSRAHVLNHPTRVRRFEDANPATRAAIQDAGFGHLLALAGMPQTATSARWHLCIAFIMLCLAAMLLVVFRFRDYRSA